MESDGIKQLGCSILYLTLKGKRCLGVLAHVGRKDGIQCIHQRPRRAQG